VFDSPEVAREIAAKRVSNPIVYAYRVPLASEGVNPSPLPSSFERIGFDVARRSFTPQFECSPLSCNGMAQEVAVNEQCLLDSLPTAVEFARRCAREQPEPGSYFVIEVWRER
jgi:hypothetical protein